MHPRYLLNDPDSEGRNVSAPYQDLTTAIRHYREALCLADEAKAQELREKVRELIRSYAD
jgi:hypothetical protein